MNLRHLQRLSNWSHAQIDASVTEFRRSLPSSIDDSVRLAIHAGKKMAARLAKAGNVVKNLDKQQVDYWRKLFGVPKNRTVVMLAVAWGELHHPQRKPERKKAALGTAAPRTTAKKMIAKRGPDAEAFIIRAKLNKGRGKAYWARVLAVLAELRSKAPTPEPQMSPGRRGAAEYMRYLARNRKALGLSQRRNS